jgi:hypothetical protein
VLEASRGGSDTSPPGDWGEKFDISVKLFGLKAGVGLDFVLKRGEKRVRRNPQKR